MESFQKFPRFFGGVLMYGLLVTRNGAKAEQIAKKFSRRVQVRHGRSTLLLYSGRPLHRDICMKCDQTGICPITGKRCYAEQVIDEALIGLRALEYARVKARIIFPAP